MIFESEQANHRLLPGALVQEGAYAGVNLLNEAGLPVPSTPRRRRRMGGWRRPGFLEAMRPPTVSWANSSEPRPTDRVVITNKHQNQQKQDRREKDERPTTNKITTALASRGVNSCGHAGAIGLGTPSLRGSSSIARDGARRKRGGPLRHPGPDFRKPSRRGAFPIIPILSANISTGPPC